MGFYGCEILQQKLHKFRICQLSRSKDYFDSIFWESNDYLESKFQVLQTMSHWTSKNFHPALAKTEPVMLSKDAIQPIRKFCSKFLAGSLQPHSTPPRPPQINLLQGIGQQFFRSITTNFRSVGNFGCQTTAKF